MDTIDKWLKSLRLHKYTHLFKSLTYDEMLNIEERYLIEREVTKGARNKMLVSVKKLNLRQERLMNMMEDLNQDNISMKEALTVLKDMLITPIPPPQPQSSFHQYRYRQQLQQQQEMCRQQVAQSPTPTVLSSSSSCISSIVSSNNNSPSLVMCSSSSASSSSSSSTSSSDSSSSSASPLSSASPSICSTISSSASPTSIISSGATGSLSTMDSQLESIYNSIMSKNNPPLASNIDKNNITSIATKTATSSSVQSSIESNYLMDPYELTYLFIETLEKVAHRLIESAGMEDNACHGIMAAIVDECLKHNSFTKEQKAKVASFKQHFTKEQKAKVASFRQQLRQQRQPHSYNHHHYYHHQQIHQHLQPPPHQFHHRNHIEHQAPALSGSLPAYGEYSLLGPGRTFELPCLRALVTPRRELCFLGMLK